MTAFLWNIALAAAWAMALGEMSFANLAIGYVLGYFVLWLGGDLLGASGYCAKAPRVVEFSLFFLWELIKANVRVALDVVTPKHHMQPGIIGVPLDAETDGEITLLANFLTLTPGTLSLDVSTDRRVLYVHAMYLDDIEEQKSLIKQGFERRLLEILR